MTRRSLLLSAGALAALGKTRGVEFGVCGSAADFSKAEQWGFDYYEPGAASIAAMSESDFAQFRDRVLASRLRCRSFNSLIRTLKVVGLGVNLDPVSVYLDTALDRCRQLGARVAVWGSASSREVPPGFSRDEAWEQIKTFLRRAGEIARAKQITIGIEPLRKQESNIINTGAEALRLVDAVNHPHVKMIIDYYHLRVEKEDPEIVRHARNQIVHLHFANPQGRRWPRESAEDPEYGRFFSILKEIDYQGGLSIEGSGRFENDAEASLAFFRDQLK
ncbi:MAG: sugar phosphate isomerase/epimerase [Acidobacteriia bacterium]|nr:sugar phosphate isomerase/epimerase [Terriglobia bacterium]